MEGEGYGILLYIMVLNNFFQLVMQSSILNNNSVCNFIIRNMQKLMHFCFLYIIDGKWHICHLHGRYGFEVIIFLFLKFILYQSNKLLSGYKFLNFLKLIE